jgi:peptidoglycan/LPS O-acetylase OafA/YrhL
MIAADRLLSWRDMLYGWVALPSLNLLQIGYSLPDGTYWSLDVEFHFYVLIFAVLLLRLRNHILLAVCGYTVVEVYFLKPHQTNLVFYPFFIAGLAVVAFSARRTLLALSGIAFAILLDLYFLLNGFSQPSVPVELPRSIMLWISIVAMIAAAKIRLPGGAVTALKPLAYVGLISYPLYLIHQDVGCIFFNWIGVPYSDTLYPRLLRLILAPALFVPIAGLIHAYVERPLIGPLTRLLSGRRRSPIAASVPAAAE